MEFEVSAELVGIYLEDAREHLAALDDALLRLERSGPDSDLAASLLGPLHTLKGNSGMMGFTGIKDYVHRLLIPTEDVVEIRRHKKQVKKRKFFPGYVLADMNIDNNTYWLIRNTPGVTGFLGGVKPTPLPEAEIQARSRRVLPRPYEGDGWRQLIGAY